MAPAAADTIERNLEDLGREPEDYDRIITGDLGYVGKQILLDLLKGRGIDIKEQHLSLIHILHALTGVNQEIRKGEVVVIVGPSGSGKSTFLRSLNLLEVPTEGHIYFDGTDLTGKKVDLDKHRQRMGMVFQHFNLFPHMTILKNMTLAPMKLQKRPKEEVEKQAMELLQRVGLADRCLLYTSFERSDERDPARWSSNK